MKTLDWKVFASGGATLFVIGLCLAVQGCDLQKMVKFDVPKGVQGIVETNEVEPLSNSIYVWEQWTNWVDTNSKQLSANIEDANDRVQMISNLTSMGMGALQEAGGQFPGGAILFSGLSLLTGWFLKRPGEEKRLSKEKEDSYNAGMEIAKSIIEETNSN
tara:strand:- start:378 stop:857 length:480 start_codon:yes stop_codon:yes gene_type:complete